MKSGYNIPENLNLTLLLRQKGLTRLNKEIHRDKFYYIIDNLYLRYLADRKDRDEYLPIYSGILDDILTHRFAALVKYALVSIGVLEQKNRHFGVGESYQFRFTEKYRAVKFQMVKPSDQTLISRIERFRIKENARYCNLRPELLLLRKTLHELSFDADLAEQMIAVNQYDKPYSLEQRKSTIQIFRDMDIHISVGKLSHRVHHLLTMCSRDLRPFYSWKGKALHQVDVSSCQPAIASLLYKEDCEEKKRYVDLMLNNTFYDFLNNGTGNKYNFSNSKVKKAFKVEAFAKIFFCHPDTKKTDLTLFFENQFPILANRINEEKAGNHRNLARNIQKKEASILIETAANGFAEAHKGKDACLLTIHDSLVSTEENMDELEDRLREAMNKALGFCPNAKRSLITGSWGKDELNDAARAVAAEYHIPGTQPKEEVIEYNY